MKPQRILSTTWSPEDQAAAGFEGYEGWVQAGRCFRAQHYARAWEYAGAVGALDQQQEVLKGHRLILDVGGDGSPFAWLVAKKRHEPVQIIDPEFNGLEIGTGCGFDEQVLSGRELPSKPWPLAHKADFIACISVIEHVADERAFLRDLVDLLAPGGVLFITTDYVDEAPDGDVFMFSHMRKRIYTRASWYGEAPADRAQEVHEPRLHESVRARVCNLGCGIFGGYDTTYHGPIPGLGYSFASLCVRKEG